MISIIIIQYNRQNLTIQAIESIKRNCRDGYEIILVDNGSKESNLEELRSKFPRGQVGIIRIRICLHATIDRQSQLIYYTKHRSVLENSLLKGYLRLSKKYLTEEWKG